MKLRRHRRIVAVLLALGLSGAQWLAGRGRGPMLCESGACPRPDADVALRAAR